MSFYLGDLVDKVGRGLTYSPQAEARKKAEQAEELARERARRDEEDARAWASYLKLGDINFKNSGNVAALRNETENQDTLRARGNQSHVVGLTTEKLMPAQTQQQVMLGKAQTGNQKELLGATAQAVQGVDTTGIQNRINAVNQVLPTINNQIIAAQAGPQDLARYAINANNELAGRRLDLLEKMYAEQNRKPTFLETLGRTAPALLTTALMLAG